MDGPSLTMPRDVFDNGAAFIEDFGVQYEKVLETNNQQIDKLACIAFNCTHVSCFSNEYILLT